MYNNNYSANQRLEDEAKKRRTYNANPEQKECPVVVSYLKSKEHCQHTEMIKKYLFNSHYFECAKCGKEL